MPSASQLECGPVGDDELNSLFQCFETATGVGLAVSGGADSTALMVLAARWKSLTNAKLVLHVLTVDHGLRPEAAGETARVAVVADELGLPVSVLRWTGPAPSADIQARARRIRYRLMIGRARQLGLSHIALAHHCDDQAETFMMRLARGSGVFGLAAMKTEVDNLGMALLRPFLALPRDRLVASLEAADREWIEDRSNSDRRYARVRWRQLMPELAREGLDAPRLAASARGMARVADLVAGLVAQMINGHGQLTVLGPARIALAPLREAHEEVALRTLAKLIAHVSGADYPPRLAKLEVINRALAVDGHAVAKRTLGGVVIERVGDVVWIYRELGRIGLPTIAVDPGATVIWDGAVEVAADSGAPAGLKVRAIGRDGLARLGPSVQVPGPGRVFETSVSVWGDSGPVLVPALDWARQECERVVRLRRQWSLVC